eukprot:CAMPEP_0172314500 /NCGR_PEP_ID=MMETSP1058-20130122/22704_1 /TAXON_ID=83371 /ORGANISM="Detonula confervacea, Strain CCMP 353" /LENGTH=57 /DNA_ID=CAMNT_0013028385 /DNA_START=266 /DNA_END=439 /DNA_ORIENTATION=+
MTSGMKKEEHEPIIPGLITMSPIHTFVGLVGGVVAMDMWGGYGCGDYVCEIGSDHDS